MDGTDEEVRPRMVTVEEGEFAGWRTFPRKTFEYVAVGPLYSKRLADRSIITAFRADQRHLNDLGMVHGGVLMTFADNALFNIAQDALKGSDWSVTVTMNSEFLGAAHEGDLLQATGEVTRAGGSTVFARGLVTAEGRPCLAFSGSMKKGRSKS